MRAGRRAWVTRDEGPDGPLGAALAAEGLVAVHEPVVERVALGDAREAIAALQDGDWLVFSSAFAVMACRRRLAPVPGVRVAAVGEATAAALRAAGCEPALVGGAGVAALRERLVTICSTGTIVHPRSAQAEPFDPWPSVRVIRPIVCETRPRLFDRDVASRVDLAVLASPTAAEALRGIDVPVVTIGPTTSATARACGLDVRAEAVEPTFAALARACDEATKRSEGATKRRSDEGRWRASL